MDLSPVRIPDKSGPTTTLSGLKPMEMTPFAKSMPNLCEIESRQQEHVLTREATTSEEQFDIETHISNGQKRFLTINSAVTSFHENLDCPNKMTGCFLQSSYQNSDDHYSNAFALLACYIHNWTEKSFSRKPSEKRVLKPELQNKFTDYLLSTGCGIDVNRIYGEKLVRIYAIERFIWNNLIEEVFKRDYMQDGTLHFLEDNKLQRLPKKHKTQNSIKLPGNLSTVEVDYSREISQLLTNISSQLNPLSTRSVKYKKLKVLFEEAFYLAAQSQLDVVPVYPRFTAGDTHIRQQSSTEMGDKRFVLLVTPSIFRQEKTILWGNTFTC